MIRRFLNPPNMDDPPQRKAAVHAQAVRGLTALEPAPERPLKCLDCIDSYADIDHNEGAGYQRDYPEETKTMSRSAERFREEGMQQGKALVSEPLLRVKFGALPAAV